METPTIESHFHGNGGVPLLTPGLAGGTMSDYPQVATAGTVLTYQRVGIPIDFKVVVMQGSPVEQPDIEQKFHKLTDQWRKETGHLSSATKKVMHPAYQQIIGMGREALPLILRELRRTRGHWLWALFSITGEDPAPEGSTFSEATDAWLSWGIRHGYAAPD